MSEGPLRAAVVTPLSGPLAGFGRDGVVAIYLWARHAAAGLELEPHDAHPDPAAAMRTAVSSRPDLVFGPYGSGPARRAAAATDRLVWNHGGASTGLTWARHPNVINVLSPPDTYLEGVVVAASESDADLHAMTLLHSDTGFGRDVADGAATRATALGIEVRRASFPPGDASQVSAPAADLLCVAAGFADERALARRYLPGRWRMAAFVGAGEEDVLAGLGDERELLLGPAQWLPTVRVDPEIGPDAAWFVEAFRAETGRDPSYPAAQAFAAAALAGHCVDLAGTTDDAALRETCARLDTTTLFGRFRLDAATGRQIGHRVLTVQWQNGRREVVWPPDRSTAALLLRSPG